MTSKDFKLIANVLYDAQLDNELLRDLAWMFADRLQATNPDFKRDRFIIAACEGRERSHDG